MNNKFINYETVKILDNRRRLALQKADENLNIALNSSAFKNAYNEKNELIPEIARKIVLKEDYSELQNRLEFLTVIMDFELKKVSLTEKDIVPNYYCGICNDTGNVNGVKCQCYIDVFDTLSKRELKASTTKSTRLSDVKDDIISADKKEIYNKLINSLKRVVSSFPNLKTKFLVFCGASGCGKTYLANAMLNDFKARNFNVLSLTAFALNDAFLKYHTVFDGSTADILTPIMSSDILLVDDLGTEPFFKNITNEYLISVINERTSDGKLTIITTNFSPDMISTHYNSRINSRLSDNNTSKIIKFDFDDLRIQSNNKQG